MADFFKTQLKREEEYQSYRRYREILKHENPEKRTREEKIREAGMFGLSLAELERLDKLRALENKIMGN